MSTEFGKYLRDVRIKKGYSIEDIQEITKIRSRYIEAIEEGNLDQLPGSFYAKAFIKSYGEVLEIDSDLIEQYQNIIPDVEDDVSLPARTAHSLAKPPSKIGKYLKTSFIYLLVLVVLLLIYALIVSNSSNQPKQSKENLDNSRLQTTEKPTQNQNAQISPQQTQQQQTAQTDQNQHKGSSGVEITKISTTSYKNRSKDVYEIVSVQNQNINVQLSFTDNCWFEIRKGGSRGKIIVMNTLGKGEITDPILLDEQELWIHLGNASAVQLNVNDQKIAIGNEPGPKYISIQKKK